MGSVTHYIDEYAPMVQLNGVSYQLAIGEGDAVIDPLYGRAEPVYVWVCKLEPTYNAPPHVSRELDDRMWRAEEIRRAERRAGWDPNP
jgi:hypothetical protein